MDVYPSALLGYRFWSIGYQSELLSLTTRNHEWDVLNEARCLKDPSHKIPQGQCQCGLYAYHSSQVALTQFKHLSHFINPWEDVLMIGGLVAGGGLIHIHKDGFRAQKMQILGFLTTPLLHSSATGSALLKRYPVKCFADIEQLKAFTERLDLMSFE